jgi:hypothetical protein
MYLKGIGVRQNAGQALKWMMFAARKRFAPAETMLGDLYWDGTVVERDRAQAIKWYMLASETVGREANPHIADRLESMMAEASDSERLSGRMGAELWADRFPETTSSARRSDPRKAWVTAFLALDPPYGLAVGWVSPKRNPPSWLRPRAHASSSITTGTWSDGFSQPRTCLSTRAATSRSAACGDSSEKSMRMPLFFCHEPAW